MARITVRAIEALKPKEQGYKVSIERGLMLRVAPDGSKVWLVRFRIDGKQFQARLPRPYGSSADTGHMSLAQATAENGRIQALARDGVDYRVANEAARQQDAAAKVKKELEETPFQALFEAWLENGVSRKDGNAELNRTFGKDVLPSLGDLTVRDVTDSNLLSVLRAVGRTRGRCRTAERMLTEMRQMYRWAVKRPPWRSLLQFGNPAELVELKQVVRTGYAPVVRDRILSPAEIRELREIFSAMSSSYVSAKDRRTAARPVEAETQLALWLCLATGCRIGELLRARWRDVNLVRGVWFVPRANTKTNVDWTVYLSPFALRQFEALHALTGSTEWCFPARSGDCHVIVKTVSKQVGDRQTRFKSRRPLAHRRHDDSLVLGDGANGAWTPQDLRRTAATMMQSLRISPDVIDRCQNHVLPGSKVRRHYLHHDYAEEKREAWRLLGDRLESILSSDNVLAFQHAA